MNFILKELLLIKNCRFEYVGSQKKLDHRIDGVSVDSRTIRANEIYFALRGENHDGHNFVEQAFANQAMASVVERAWWKNNRAKIADKPVFLVDDTLKALQESAHAYRKKFSLPVLGLTGTNGKTTTKEMIAAVLENLGAVCKTEGNLNNHIGLPLTLFKLEAQHRALIPEMGANHFGEIARLCEIAEPGMGLITNIGHGHTEFFGNLEGVARAKMELFEYLKRGGVGFINIEDPLIVKHAPGLKKKVTYGFKEEADIFGEKLAPDEFGHPQFKVDDTVIKLQLLGSHNVINALAAVAVGAEFGIELDKIKSALENIHLPAKRMEIIKRKNVTILNDSYNANPESTLAALATLRDIPATGKRIFVLGDMLELGEQAGEEHARIGKSLKQFGVTVFLAYGAETKAAVKAAQEIGKEIYAKHFDSKIKLSSELKNLLKEGDVVLIKGSRGMRMEEIMERLF